ncbi:hypothetical protein ACJIZ3_008801 [Penstemon smallii]|uniref:Uncharacterized protein n=1 Tax=Penstemon smallii TaxID=265156 RepID=A0ABD3TAT1_9LAMI
MFLLVYICIFITCSNVLLLGFCIMKLHTLLQIMTSRGATGGFGLKGIECAYFPRSLLGSSIQPIDVSADDDDALVVAPISMMEGELSPEAAAPKSDEINPLAIVLYEGPDSGAGDHVNGGGLSDVDSLNVSQPRG